MSSIVVVVSYWGGLEVVVAGAGVIVVEVTGATGAVVDAVVGLTTRTCPASVPEPQPASITMPATVAVNSQAVLTDKSLLKPHRWSQSPGMSGRDVGAGAAGNEGAGGVVKRTNLHRNVDRADCRDRRGRFPVQL